MPPRIVSLVPSITESLFDLDLAARIVGRTRFCIHPKNVVRRVPILGGTKDVDIPRVRAIAPSHVIVNVDENTRPTVDALRGFVPRVVVTHPKTPEDAVALFRELGSLFERQCQADALCGALEGELAACRACRWPVERVLYLIWKDPWMTVASDTYIAGMLGAVGWEVLHGPGGDVGPGRYPTIPDLDAAVSGAGRVLLSSEPYRFRETDLLTLRARYPHVPIDLIDGEMTSWYGSRSIRGLAYLRDLRTRRSGLP